MDDGVQRLLTMSGPEVMSLNAQAALGDVRPPERSQFVHLVRLFLERFFHHETASADGDAKTRLVQIAAATGLPGLMVAVYLWPVYHPVIVFPPRHDGVMPGPPPYWVQVNHHFFFVLYSFVVMGLATVFEWDLFFPDLLDVFVLGALPVPERRVFFARVAAIAIFVCGFLFDANFLAPIVLPMATDPPSLTRLLAGHLLAVSGAGIFAAAFVLAFQGVLLSVFGERLFRKMSLALQGLGVALLVMLLLLFPVLSGVTPAILQSGKTAVLWCPPFWFLGVYQRILDGPAALPVYTALARNGLLATLAIAAVGMAAYPIAYVRRVRQLILGPGARRTRSRVAAPWRGVLHGTVVRAPVRRAVFHFIGQTLLRVPRYRIYLVLYGGVGLSAVAATILRFTATRGQIRAEFSADGMRVAIAIVAFWVVAGLRTTFVAGGNQQGGWIWRVVHGRPAQFEAAIERLRAARTWVFLCAAAVTFAAVGLLHLAAPPELRTGTSIAAQLLVGGGLCLLLTDAAFSRVLVTPLTGEAAHETQNLAFTVLRYFTFFPLVTALSLAAELWMEADAARLGIAAAVVVVAHLWLRKRHTALVKLHSSQIELEDDEEDFPMKLGLRY